MPLTPSQALIRLVLNGYQSQRTAVLERLDGSEGIEIDWPTPVETQIYVFFRLFWMEHRRAPESYEVIESFQETTPEVLDYLVSLDEEAQQILAEEDLPLEAEPQDDSILAEDSPSDTERAESQEERRQMPLTSREWREHLIAVSVAYPPEILQSYPVSEFILRACLTERSTSMVWDSIVNSMSRGCEGNPHLLRLLDESGYELVGTDLEFVVNPTVFSQEMAHYNLDTQEILRKSVWERLGEDEFGV